MYRRRSHQRPPKGNPVNSYGFYQGSMSNHDKVYTHLIKALDNPGYEFASALDGMKTVEIIEKYMHRLLQNKIHFICLKNIASTLFYSYYRPFVRPANDTDLHIAGNGRLRSRDCWQVTNKFNTPRQAAL